MKLRNTTMQAALLVAALAATALGQEYTLTPLGFLPNGGTDGSWAWGMSEDGKISGEATSTNAPVFAEAHVWDNGVMTGLGNLSVGPNYHSKGMDVNDAKQVVGWGSTPLGWEAFIWDTVNGIQGLGYVGGCPGGETGTTFFSQANGINQGGEVTGVTSTASNCFEAFLWAGGSYQQTLGSLSGHVGSVGQDINNAIPVQIVGSSYQPITSLREAFVWDPVNGMTGLGYLFGDTDSFALGLNDLGDVAGRSDLEGTVWLTGNGLVPQSIGFVGSDTSSIAWDINNDLQAVGASGFNTKAIIWDPCNLIRDLNTLVDLSGSGWTLWYAYAINDAGQIAVWGRNPVGDIEAARLDPILGACCLPDGSCQQTTLSECVCLSGLYMGNGSDCMTAPCSSLDGACCVPGAPCFITTAIDCQAIGGLYMGNGVPCTPDPCNPPTGACCVTDQPCFITTALDCLELGGVYHGDFVPCTPDPCPTGACCIDEPGIGLFCIITTSANCQFLGGIYHGDGSICTPDPCPPPPTGACCHLDPTGLLTTCTVTDQATCEQVLFGTYQGDNVPCIPDPCGDPTGACCVEDGAGGFLCIIQTNADCLAQGGIYFGDGSTCTPDPCPPVADGACCLLDPGTTNTICQMITQFDCENMGGTYLGDFVPCTPDPCPHVGACCLGCDPGCMTLSQTDCLSVGGLYLGDGVICGATDPQCPAFCGIDLSTGTTGVLVDLLGNVDPDWHVNFTPFTGAGPAYSIAPVTAWTTSSKANWIDPFNTGGSTPAGYDPIGNYAYEINFTLDTTTMADFVLNLQVASDNASQFFLNGNPIASIGSGAFGLLTPINVTNQTLFVNGVNSLVAAVTNDGAWTGLLVEGKVNWRAKLANVSTGTTGPVPDPAGAIDPDWTTISTPNSGVGPAFSLTPLGAYVTLPGVANWIDPYNNNPSSFDPAGNYVYQMQFTLNFADYEDFRLDLDLAADNTMNLFLNGNLVGSSPGFGSLTSLTVINQSSFLPGINTLRAEVVNFNDFGPTALLVGGCVTAKCRETDCNDNGVHDAVDLQDGTLTDNNGNGIPDQCECVGDTNGDGTVNVADLINVVLDWGCVNPPGPCIGDVNMDGVVNVADLLDVILNWGPCP